MIPATAPSAPGLLATWQVDPGLIAALAAAAAWYLALRRRARRWDDRRTIAFLAGLALVAVALLSGLDVYADRLLSVHMAEHMVLMLLAAPCLVVGAPLTLALRAGDQATRGRLAAVARSRAARILTQPLVAFSLMPAALALTHLTPFYDLALRHPWAHALEHAVYLATALAFWTPLVGAEPLPHRLSGLARAAYLIALMPPMSAIAAVLVSADHPLYAAYRGASPALGVDPVSDQHLAGALMWVAGGAVAMAIGLVAAWRAFEREEAAARVLDRRVAAGAASSRSRAGVGGGM